MAAFTSAGSIIRISAALPATFNAAGYQALTYSTIGEITDFGEFGREYNLVSHNPVGNRSTQKFKGSFNEGSMTLQMALDTDDLGQILAKAALLSDANYSFLVQTQNLDRYYFMAQTLSFKVGIGSVDQITTATIQLELTTSSTGVGIVEVLAP